LLTQIYDLLYYISTILVESDGASGSKKRQLTTEDVDEVETDTSNKASKKPPRTVPRKI